MYKINLLISELGTTTLVKEYTSTVPPLVGDHILLLVGGDKYFIVNKRVLGVESDVIVCLGKVEIPTDGNIYAP